ncbi:hypothetical protein C1H46_035543 [Malus baccata]|uniref:Uncharacterized protein n=1 Tax=Malus baccata TaxID=106549 RepID=A0A540KXF8_MALBA|nr:hypothetical protein C1H46_035543 [Malus baccata]
MHTQIKINQNTLENHRKLNGKQNPPGRNSQIELSKNENKTDPDEKNRTFSTGRVKQAVSKAATRRRR